MVLWKGTGLGFLIIVLAGGYSALYFKKKKYILMICRSFLQDDFKKFMFSQKTLYQIGEFYSHKYGAASLLQGVVFMSSGIRKAVFYVLILATFIAPLNFWYTCGFVLAAHYISYGVINMNFVYKRIK